MEKELYKGKFLRLTTEDKDGRIFERVYLRDTVLVIPITDTGGIRFIKEHDWDQDIIKTKLVSGYIETNETPLECAKRELKEELGLSANTWEGFITAIKRGTLQTTQYFFIARELQQGEAHPDQVEKIEGYTDLSLTEVHKLALEEKFGQTATAFTLLKFINQATTTVE